MRKFLQKIGVWLMVCPVLVCVPDFAAADVREFIRFTHLGDEFKVTWIKKGRQIYVFNPGAPKRVTVTTLEWPPYIGETICRQGWVQQFTVALLAVRGYEVTCQFLPWARTIARAETGQADILYPEYYIEPSAPSDVILGSLRRDHLALSDKFPGGPIAFIKRKGETDAFQGNLMNLKGEKIGVVRGYQNTPLFDSFMDKGFFDISLAVDDVMNVQLLLNRRVNLIVGDPATIRYHLAHSGAPATIGRQILAKIEVVAPILKYNHLYFAVSKKRTGWERILEDLNRGIALFESSGLTQAIIESVRQACD